MDVVSSSTSIDQVYVSNKHYKELTAAGFLSVSDYLDSDPDVVAVQSGIRLQDIQLLRSSLFAILQRRVIGAPTLLQEFAKYKLSISTGIPELDEMLCGVKNGEILEVCGASLSGKTQVCLRTAITCSSLGKKSILYIDTSGQADPSRWLQALKNYKLSQKANDDILKSISLMNLSSVHRLIQLLLFLCNPPCETNTVILPQFIFIDSVYALLVSEIVGGSVEGFGLMNQLIFALRKVISFGQTILIVTNLTSINAAEGNLGTFWQAVPNHRLLLKRVNDHEDIDVHISDRECFSGTLVKSATMMTHVTSRLFAI